MIDKYFKSSLLNTFERSVYLISALISYAIIARSLGLEQFGEFAKLMFVYQLLSFLSASTADQAMQNRLSKKKANVLQDYVVIRSFFSLTASVFTLFIFFVTHEELLLEHYLITFIHIAFILHSTEAEIKFHGNSEIIVKARFASSLFTLTLRILGWSEGYDITFFVFTYLFESLIYGILLNYFNTSGSRDFRINYLIIKQIYKTNFFKRSAYLFASAAVVVLYSRMDFISMYIFVSDKEFGEYTAAYRLIEVYSVFVVTIILSMYPYMSLCNKKDRAIIASKILSLILLLSFIAILLFYFVGSIVIELFYGSEFSNISDIGMIILLTVIISNIVVLTTNLLLLMELEKIRLYRALIGLFTSLIIILPSTYLYGLMGAAISSTVVQLVLLVMSFYLKGSETINPILRDGVLFRNGISIWKK